MEDTPQHPAIRGLRTVCRCNNIKYRTIERAIREGAHTLHQVASRTTATTGHCGGSCTPDVQQMLADLAPKHANVPSAAKSAAVPSAGKSAAVPAAATSAAVPSAGKSAAVPSAGKSGAVPTAATSAAVPSQAANAAANANPNPWWERKK